MLTGVAGQARTDLEIMSVKLVLVDNDGTFIPGTEVRNRIVLQGIVDEFATRAGTVGPCTIDWSKVGGKAEPHIHAWLCEEAFPSFAAHISAEEFTARAKNGYRITEPDYTAREGLVTLLADLKAHGIGSAIVTNSDREPIMHALKRSFDMASTHKLEDVFPLVITADEVKENGLLPKPAPDPFHLALRVYNEMHGTDIKPHEVLILEDSPTGVGAGEEMTGSPKNVVQFVDLAPACASAAHHVTDVAEIRQRFFAHVPSAPKLMAA